MAYVNAACAGHMLLVLVLAANSARFPILLSYMPARSYALNPQLMNMVVHEVSVFVHSQ